MMAALAGLACHSPLADLGTAQVLAAFRQVRVEATSLGVATPPPRLLPCLV